MVKPVTSLTLTDLELSRIWKFVNSDSDELLISPVKKYPVKDLAGKLVATQVRLANGNLVWGILGNIDQSNPKLTQHFLTISFFHKNEWFTLARYHDFDFNENGPEKLSEFLSLSKNSIFPISYDIRDAVEGAPEFLKGEIPSEPVEVLTRAQIIALAVP